MIVHSSTHEETGDAMNKRKKVAMRKHRIKARKTEAKRKPTTSASTRRA
jgi:hypothetical protein